MLQPYLEFYIGYTDFDQMPPVLVAPLPNVPTGSYFVVFVSRFNFQM
jgi:hypothetical protein